MIFWDYNPKFTSNFGIWPVLHVPHLVAEEILYFHPAEPEAVVQAFGTGIVKIDQQPRAFMPFGYCLVAQCGKQAAAYAPSAKLWQHAH